MVSIILLIYFHAQTTPASSLNNKGEQYERIFDDTRSGVQVKNGIVSTIQTDDFLACLRKCMLCKGCKSININIYRSMCHLLEISLSEKEQEMKADENSMEWLYYGEVLSIEYLE